MLRRIAVLALTRIAVFALTRAAVFALTRAAVFALTRAAVFALTRAAVFAESRALFLDDVGETWAERAGLLPKLSTRISGRSRPVASRILSFCASVNLIFTSFAMFVPPLMPCIGARRGPPSARSLDS